jgi:alpha-D-ribose 1-methylphosphonate 5-triphosphate synthase subunit PhnG
MPSDFAPPRFAFGGPATVPVLCSTTALTAAINAANTSGRTTILVLRTNCTYLITTPATATAGLPLITGGGGLFNLGTTTVEGSQIQLNQGSAGGGIATGNTNVTLSRSAVRSNFPDNCNPLNTIAGAATSTSRTRPRGRPGRCAPWPALGRRLKGAKAACFAFRPGISRMSCRVGLHRATLDG